jgi:hypothetical protein
MATAAEVARWMLTQLNEEEYLYQSYVVAEIEEKFGDAFVYYNANGNPAISPAVLKEFRRLTGDIVIWNRAERYWRKREEWDEPGRRQG